MLKFVNKVVVQFHPFHPKNGTARQMAVFLNSSKMRKEFPKDMMSPEHRHLRSYPFLVVSEMKVEYDEMIEPTVTVDYSTNETKVYQTANIKFQDLQSQMLDHLSVLERDAAMSAPQLDDDDNPYLELAEQHLEKIQEKKARALATAKKQ